MYLSVYELNKGVRNSFTVRYIIDFVFSSRYERHTANETGGTVVFKTLRAKEVFDWWKETRKEFKVEKANLPKGYYGQEVFVGPNIAYQEARLYNAQYLGPNTGCMGADKYGMYGGKWLCNRHKCPANPAVCGITLQGNAGMVNIANETIEKEGNFKCLK